MSPQSADAKLQEVRKLVARTKGGAIQYFTDAEIAFKQGGSPYEVDGASNTVTLDRDLDLPGMTDAYMRGIASLWVERAKAQQPQLAQIDQMAPMAAIGLQMQRGKLKQAISQSMKSDPRAQIGFAQLKTALDAQAPDSPEARQAKELVDAVNSGDYDKAADTLIAFGQNELQYLSQGVTPAVVDKLTDSVMTELQRHGVEGFDGYQPSDPGNAKALPLIVESATSVAETGLNAAVASFASRDADFAARVRATREQGARPGPLPKAGGPDAGGPKKPAAPALG